ncbi:MAG: ABC transporter ATP-binding protein [Pseudomonadota bacterium]
MSLELKQVAKRVGAEVHIHPTTLTLERGAFNVLLGTTLAGKTTLMQLMAGIERPTGGEVWFDGYNVTGVPVRRRNVSMVYQQFINYPHFTIYENIASPLRVARLDKSEIDRRVRSVAELLKLDQMLKRQPNELSGGQQQRTAMARALVKDSDIILLDEPLANLDFKLREELRDELPKIFADRDCIVVYATTEPTEALLFGGYTATLHEGRVTQFGETSGIYRAPADLLSARVFSDPPINIASVTKADGEIRINDQIRWPASGRFAGLPDGPMTLGLRPHFVHATEVHDHVVPIDVTVQVTELSGSESVVHFNLDGMSWVSLAHGIHLFDVGAHARLYADMDHALYFAPDDTLIAP